MKIDERKALNTQKPQSEKLYETKAGISSGGPKKPAPGREDLVALDSQDQLRSLAISSTEDTSRIARLTQLVQSGQYQVDPVELSGAMVAAMLKGY